MTGVPAGSVVCVRGMPHLGAVHLAHHAGGWRRGDDERKQNGKEPPQHWINYSVVVAGDHGPPDGGTCVGKVVVFVAASLRNSWDRL